MCKQKPLIGPGKPKAAGVPDDADDVVEDDSDDESSDDDDDDDDEEVSPPDVLPIWHFSIWYLKWAKKKTVLSCKELMRELAKIKREREEDKKKQESLAAEEQKEQEKEAALQGLFAPGLDRNNWECFITLERIAFSFVNTLAFNSIPR